MSRARALTWFQKSVTVTSTAAEIVAEDLSGQNIFITNNDSTGIVYLNFSGTATATDTMIVLDPDDSISAENITNNVSAIGDIASNANVAVIISK